MPIDRDRDPRPLALAKRLHNLRGNLQPPHRLRRLDVGSKLHDLTPLASMVAHKTDERRPKGQMLIHARAGRSRLSSRRRPVLPKPIHPDGIPSNRANLEAGSAACTPDQDRCTEWRCSEHEGRFFDWYPNAAATGWLVGNDPRGVDRPPAVEVERVWQPDVIGGRPAHPFADEHREASDPPRRPASP